MKAIVGIGNPGREYKDTRHNIGFRVVDALKKFASSQATEKVILKKPSTFVNRMGPSVAALVKKHRLSPGGVLLVCDDVNLSFGKLRLRAKGSSGGHKGLESVIDALGTEEFPRLRIGVKNEKTPKDLAPFVLEKFTRQEQDQLPGILEKAVSVCQAWVLEGFSSALDQLSKVKSTKE